MPTLPASPAAAEKSGYPFPCDCDEFGEPATWASVSDAEDLALCEIHLWAHSRNAVSR